MDYELIWWCVVGGCALVFMLLAFITAPKQKKNDIVIFRVGK